MVLRWSSLCVYFISISVAWWETRYLTKKQIFWYFCVFIVFVSVRDKFAKFFSNIQTRSESDGIRAISLFFNQNSCYITDLPNRFRKIQLNWSLVREFFFLKKKTFEKNIWNLLFSNKTVYLVSAKICFSNNFNCFLWFTLSLLKWIWFFFMWCDIFVLVCLCTVGLWTFSLSKSKPLLY